MNVAILDGTNGIHRASQVLVESVNETGVSYTHLKLESLNLKPCIGCNGCNYKTPGECILKDDTSQLMRAYVNAGNVIILTPVSFGGYAATTKKAIDKLSLTALPSFVKHKGRIQHPHRYPVKKGTTHPSIITIAVLHGNSMIQQQSFEKLIHANSEIMMTANTLVFVNEQDDRSIMKSQIASVLRKVIR